MEQAAFEPAEVRFRPGDQLLLSSDGVTEARDPSGRQIGLDRLDALAERGSHADLPAPETLPALPHAVDDHQAGPPRDDATLVLVEWSAAAARRSPSHKEIVSGSVSASSSRFGSQSRYAILCAYVEVVAADPHIVAHNAGHQYRGAILGQPQNRAVAAGLERRSENEGAILGVP